MAPVPPIPMTSRNDYSAFEDDEDDDTTHSLSFPSTSNPLIIPGSYDFEPQLIPTPSISRSRPPSIQSTSPPALHQHQHHHRSASSTTDRILSFLTPSFLSHSPTPTLPTTLPNNRIRLVTHSSAEDSDPDLDDRSESHSLLFSHSTSSSSNVILPPATRSRPTYPPSHVPLPPRPPTFAPPPASTTTGRVVGGGQGNDGVFANLSAKPDAIAGNRASGGGLDYVGGDDAGGGDKDEVLPAYEVAAQDTTPPYWETTIVAPHGFLGPDDICVDGLPVGNIFSFCWNLLVSMSFQFVGFLLTYLLHTSHASKNGSRAGLGITLIQLGFYLKQRVDHPELFLNENVDPQYMVPSSSSGELEPGQSWTWWGGVVVDDPSSTSSVASSTLSALGSLPTQIGGMMSGVLDASDPDSVGIPSLTGPQGEEVARMSAAANEWVAFGLVTIGSFLLIGGCLSYWRAVRFARAVRQGMAGAQADAEQRVESL